MVVMWPSCGCCGVCPPCEHCVTTRDRQVHAAILHVVKSHACHGGQGEGQVVCRNVSATVLASVAAKRCLALDHGCFQMIAVPAALWDEITVDLSEPSSTWEHLSSCKHVDTSMQSLTWYTYGFREVVLDREKLRFCLGIDIQATELREMLG